MATRIIEVAKLQPGINKPEGTLGEHYLMFFPQTKRVLGFNSQGEMVSNVDVDRNDILVYNAGEIRIMTPWRARVYRLIGYCNLIITDEVPKTHNEGCTCTTSRRSANGNFYRRVNSHLCLRITGRGNEAFSYGTGYVSAIIAKSPQDILKFLGKRENVNLVKDRAFDLSTYWVDSKGNKI